MDVCKAATNLIDTEHVKRQRGDGDALDGHALMTRLKWAGGLALLAGRTNINDQGWELSATLMAVSDATRAGCLAALAEQAERQNLARGHADGQRAAVAEQAADEARLPRICELLRSKLATGTEYPRGELAKTLRGDARRYFDQAIDRLIDAGQAVAEQRPNAQGRPTTYYRTP